MERFPWPLFLGCDCEQLFSFLVFPFLTEKKQKQTPNLSVMPGVYLHEYCIIIERQHPMNFQVFASDSFFPHLHKSQLAQESVLLP